MSCLTPLTQYHCDDGSYTFNPEKGYNPFAIPCGQCLGCRIDHSRDWALRCMHHSKQYEKNCFITLTFDDINLAGRKSVDVKDWQLFAKRFRTKLAYEGREKIEFFHAMEYGEKTSRPHHHAVVFNYFPQDAEVLKNIGGNIYYKSAELSSLWHNQGFIVVGALTYQTAAYTASYTFKKQKTKNYKEGITPEKMTCSQGIGVSHFLKYYKDYCALGAILFDGKKFRIPRGYLKKLDVSDRDLREAFKSGNMELFKELTERKLAFDNLKLDRELNARPDSILDRLKKYEYLLANQQRYKKKLYNDTPLSDDNRYLKQLKCLELQIMQISGEYNPNKKEKLHETILRL